MICRPFLTGLKIKFKITYMTKVLYLGPKFSFANLASLKYFQNEPQLNSLNDLEFVPVKNFVDLFSGVVENSNSLAIVPIENSLAGSVIPNFDFLCKYNVKIVGEVMLPIKHNLFAQKGVDLEELETIYSHPKALEQCQVFLQKHKFSTSESSSTADAIEMVSKSENKFIGAIGSPEAGQYYGLQAVAENVQDYDDNWTRFFVISGQDFEDNFGENIKNKASLIFGLPHISGSLVGALSILAKNHNQLVKIESRPIHNKPFEYTFYVDLLFTELPQFEVCLAEFTQNVINLKVLGIYPQAK
jgi:prephenate dehydratase